MPPRAPEVPPPKSPLAQAPPAEAPEAETPGTAATAATADRPAPLGSWTAAGWDAVAVAES